MAQIVKHTIRTKNCATVEVVLNRGKAIKAFCTECMGWEEHPRECTDKLCPLYPWRGKIMLTYDKEAK
jgi:hypothetical protein